MSTRPAASLPNVDLTSLTSGWNFGCLVRVKAQVMTRDDSAGMWVPLSGGGMSIVGLNRVVVPSVDEEDGENVGYMIVGQRIADKNMVLHCELLSDLNYTSVNPTFHHWSTNNKRFGLTFQTSTDATAFEKNIRQLEKNLKQERLTESQGKLHVLVDEILQVLQAQTLSQDLPSDLSESNSLSSSSSTTNPVPVAARPCHRRSITKAEIHPNATPPARVCTMPPRVNVIQKGRAKTPPASPSGMTVVVVGGDPSPPTKTRVPLSSLPRSPLGNTSSSSGATLPAISLKDYGCYVDVSGSTTEENRIDELNQTVEIVSERGVVTTEWNELEDLVYFGGSYVHFEKNAEQPQKKNVVRPEKHDYCYPSLDAVVVATPRRTKSSLSSQDIRNLRVQPPPSSSSSSSSAAIVPLPTKSRKKCKRKVKSATATARQRRHVVVAAPKSRCAYCSEYFSADANPRGACHDAPDAVLSCIKASTCVSCPQAALYHCAREEDDVGGGGGGETTFECCGGRVSCRRRIILVLVCLVLPCLWCYLPLRSCHRCGVGHGCCGPRHKATL